MSASSKPRIDRPAAVLMIWLLFGGAAGADPLDEAIALVLAASPAVAQAETALAAVNRGHAWSATVNVGYQARNAFLANADGLSGGSAGPNVGITVRIPLFDTRLEQEAMKARAGLAVTREAVLREFVQTAAELRALAGQQAAAMDTAALLRDKLVYFDQQEQAGLIEAAALWTHAEAAKQAEQTARKAQLSFETALETTARRYGGADWTTLRSLLHRYATASRR